MIPEEYISYDTLMVGLATGSLVNSDLTRVYLRPQNKFINVRKVSPGFVRHAWERIPPVHTHTHNNLEIKVDRII